MESLPGSHFIVMDFLTLADVAVAFALLPHVLLTMDPARCAALPRVVVLCSSVYGAASAALKGAKVSSDSRVRLPVRRKAVSGVTGGSQIMLLILEEAARAGAAESL